jgi:mevalonate kinase
MLDFYSHGKLLITSEYAVLDGAKALALPTRLGQKLSVSKTPEEDFEWISYDHDGSIWFQAVFASEGSNLIIKESNDDKVARKLREVLGVASHLKAAPFNWSGLSVMAQLEFNRNWGLGSSSTLVNNIAQWLSVNAFELQEQTFGGSGYDIACAQQSSPLVYQKTDSAPRIESVQLNWPFKEHIYFVYLNRKQNSRKGIFNYRDKNKLTPRHIDELNKVTEALLGQPSLLEFQSLINLHNRIIKELIDMKTPAESLFQDFNGSIKNLGAWGGDFIMACSAEDPRKYFRQKGYSTILSFEEMIA